MNKPQISFSIVMTAIFLALVSYALRDAGYYPVVFCFALEILVFLLSGRRNLLSFSLSFVPALLLAAYLAGKCPLFLILSAVFAIGIVTAFRSVRPLPRIKTQWWVSTLVFTEVLVFAALLAFA